MLLISILLNQTLSFSDLKNRYRSQKIIQISKNYSDLKKIQISKNESDLKKNPDLKKWIRSQKMIQISKNDTDLKKWYRSQKIIQISKDLKCKIKHTVVLKGHPPDLWRSPGLVSIRKEGTWISIRMLPWNIHSEELRSGQQLCA